MSQISAIPIPGIGDVRAGDSVPKLILEAVRRSRTQLQAGDILVVTHKIVSKAEGQIVPLESVKPSPSAQRWAKKYGLDARVVELAWREAGRIRRRGHGVTITETRHGFVCANSGVDASNVDGGSSVVLLPRTPDRSAQKLFREIKNRVGFPIPIVISDSFGRPWREGLTEVAIGVAGMKPLRDFRGQRDPYGYKLRASVVAVADELAGMAGLACGKLSRMPVCIIRGFDWQPGRGRAADLIRPPERDLFR